MNGIVYIGIDDTDMLGEKPGTGRVARELAQELAARGLGEPLGVTRHQLLVDPRIPYTSHNSSLCIALNGTGEVSDFVEPCANYLITHSKQGADPGLCICSALSFDEEMAEFGWQATRVVLYKSQAQELALKKGIVLKELGGTGGGIIGALAGVSLRADGNQGRFVDLAGIRDIYGTISACDILSHTHISTVEDEQGREVPAGTRIESYDWIRPSLVGGRAVLRIKPVAGNEHLWEPVENRKDKKKTQEG